jgi:hypothetical protein
LFTCTLQGVSAPPLFTLYVLTPFLLCTKAITLQIRLIFCQGTIIILQVYIVVLLTHVQPPLLLSSDDHMHHKLIGTFLLSVSAVSDIKNSHNPYP